MTGRDGRCARTAIGQIAAVPPTNVMNSRRRMYGPIVSVQSVNKKRHVRYGPKADIRKPAFAHSDPASFRADLIGITRCVRGFLVRFQRVILPHRYCDIDHSSITPSRVFPKIGPHPI